VLTHPQLDQLITQLRADDSPAADGGAGGQADVVEWGARAKEAGGARGTEQLRRGHRRPGTLTATRA